MVLALIAEGELALGLMMSERTLSSFRGSSEHKNSDSEIVTFMLELSDERDIILPSILALVN